MCGIAGISGRGNGGVADAMINALHHRGPDSKGTACLRDIAVAASRLAIVDLAGGAQPIYNETGELCIVFNGEIYNHRALRSILEQKGHRFSTHSDTEVVLHLYEEYDAKCVQQLRGMFAFAITDGERLFLARDRLGIKPLYYALLSDGKTFLFASEIKAILAFPEFSPRVDMQALADSAVLGHPIGQHDVAGYAAPEPDRRSQRLRLGFRQAEQLLQCGGVPASGTGPARLLAAVSLDLPRSLNCQRGRYAGERLPRDGKQASAIAP